VAAPLLAGVLSFVMLFFVQNVFEQPVLQPNVYVFDKPVLMELKAQGINLDYLTEVNGRKYDSSRALKASLEKVPHLSRNQKMLLSNTSEVFVMRIKYLLLRSELKADTFSTQQWQAILLLNNRSFEHAWQLEKALADLTPAWQFKPKNHANQIYNDELKKKLKILEAQAHVEEKVE
jgi:PiT family inorganic phosphate transporter